MAFDVVIRGAELYDGTGDTPREADVAIEGDRIAQVGSVAGSGEHEIDARGLALAPGFIDVHTHDDFAVLVHPDMAFKVRGGVTTCVVGNCGLGAAPFPIASFQARAFHPHHELPEWSGYAGYLRELDESPPSVNVAALIGHGTLRLGAMGNEDRAPTSAELDEMRGLVREGLDAGAVGLSTGLVYEPGKYSETEELVELTGELRGSGALYATHMRDEGTGLLESVREAIEIGERAGVPVQISHHKASGRPAWGLVRESLGLIEAAQSRGLDVHADQYPYTAGSTVLAAVVQYLAEGEHFRGEDVVIATADGHPHWEGRSIAELMQEFGLDAAATCRRVLADAPQATVVMHSMDEDDVRTVMRHESTMIGSDGLPTPEGRPHPRLYGTFARVLGHYARDLALFPLEEAIHKMTGMAARKFGLRDRGFVEPGAFADLVTFDPDAVIDVGTFDEPNEYPDGIAHVWVNGEIVVENGAHTHRRPGRALRRT
jgi:N-acyl-D-amino-acid deacylase